MTKPSLLTLVLAALLHLCDGYKILVVFPLAGKSHHILGTGYVKNLLDAGHEVTYATPFPTNKTTAKYHEIDLSDSNQNAEEKKKVLNLKAIMDKKTEIDILKILPGFKHMIKSTYENKNFLEFLSDTTQEFDVVIAEWLFYTDNLAGLASLYNCPLIWSSSVEVHSMMLELVHEPLNPSYNPNILSATIPPFSFYERAASLYRIVASFALKYIYLTPTEHAVHKEIFGPLFAKRGRQLPPYEEVVYNGTLMLINSHVSLGHPVSVPPNVKEIAGYHIDSDIKPLPANLQKIMDEAKHGVIFFSMGGNVQSKDWPEELKKGFLEVFGGLKQTVLWKFEEQLPNIPKNVHILDWAPQQSILAHPNIRLFIGHGGLLSIIETVYFGVPLVAMPYGADQIVNALRAAKQGYALMVELSYELVGEIKVAIEEMLTNPKYSERAKEVSQLFHDRTLEPGKELVYWVEYAVRTRGAPHLRSPALLLPWWQKAYLDLLAVVLVVLYAVKLVLKLLYRKVISLLKSPSKKKTN